MKGKGTIKTIFALWEINEEIVEKTRNLYMCFVDYKKAFDMMKHNDLKVMLNSIKVTRKKCKINKELILEARSHSKGID